MAKVSSVRQAASLDTAWERDLRSGKRAPDSIIDLHGHSLASAHSHLSRSLGRAVAAGARVILVVAGKARGSDEAPRGAIRRELAAWLAHSAHSDRILAVRNAHPRHGGAGALYLILRKPKRVQ
ncbi:MAG: Smr/MutS family protein [Sphingopyxis sp.]